MKSTSYKQVLGMGLAGLALGLAGWFATGQAQAVPNTVSIDLLSTTVPPGVSFTVTVNM